MISFIILFVSVVLYVFFTKQHNYWATWNFMATDYKNHIKQQNYYYFSVVMFLVAVIDIIYIIYNLFT